MPLGRPTRTLGTQITVEFGGPSADHGAPACLWGLANRARITRHSRSYVVWRAMRASLGAQIAVWVGLPHVEPKARALRKALRGKRCNCASLVRFAPARPSGARVFWESGQNACLRGYARKYTTFVQHLHVIMCLPLRVAVLLLFVESRVAWICL